MVGSSLWFITNLPVSPPRGKAVNTWAGLPARTTLAIFPNYFHTCSGFDRHVQVKVWALFFGSWRRERTAGQWFLLVMEEVPSRQQESPQNELKTDLCVSPSPCPTCPLQSSPGDRRLLISREGLELSPPPTTRQEEGVLACGRSSGRWCRCYFPFVCPITLCSKWLGNGMPSWCPRYDLNVLHIKGAEGKKWM